jgi:ribosomal protein S4
LAARQAIIHLKILVNGFIMNKPNYLLKVGDVITLNKTVINRLNFYKNLKRKTIRYKRLLLVNYPIYLEVNYKLLSIIFIKNPQVNEIPFPFLLNLELMKYRSIK